MTAGQLQAGRFACTALWLALGLQIGWLTLNATVLHRQPALSTIGAGFLVLSFVFATFHRRWRWVIVMMRVVMSADFLLAVADRFGLLGAPGQPGVQWGDFGHFVSYTRTVISFAPAGLGPAAAACATVAEIILGLALLLGIQVRLAAAGAAVLLAVYATAMTISLPAAEQFHYNVIVLGAAMLTLAALDSPDGSGRQGGRESRSLGTLGRPAHVKEPRPGAAAG